MYFIYILINIACHYFCEIYEHFSPDLMLSFYLANVVYCQTLSILLTVYGTLPLHFGTARAFSSNLLLRFICSICLTLDIFLYRKSVVYITKNTSKIKKIN